jgi:SAM-dependent MidA family methyltransferase
VTLSDRVVAEIRRAGPMRFDRFVDLALYDPEGGFFTTGGGAGRAGADFVTSPEVGPLFGAVMARALDCWWQELGEPDEFIVVEAGAGRGTLARAIVAATPACLPSLRYVAVERSGHLRQEHPGSPPVESRAELPTQSFVGVLLANELLDNLAFRLVERHDTAWKEVAVEVGEDGELVEALVASDDASVALASDAAPDARPGDRIPIQTQAVTWLEQALALVERGRIVVIDYADETADLGARPVDQWLRTYRSHGRGGPVLDAIGEQDITCEVAIDQLARVRRPTSDRSQAEFLAAHGIDDLVDEGRRIWRERAHLGDLEAMVARSRVTEAEALGDPAGLGAFRVLEWLVD